MPDSSTDARLPGTAVPVDRASHLSIGEVLALLLEEFPDVTISKIRFLESQGLIDPERTASGYRKFYDHDVELLRCILREQREHYLPLKVIKDRLDSGELDPTGEHPRPRGIVNVGPPPSDVAQPQYHPSAGARATGAAALFERTDGVETPPSAPQPSTSTPASASAPAPEPAVEPVVEPVTPVPAQPIGAVVPGVLLTGEELCALAGLTPAQLADLRSFGVVSGTSRNGDEPYDEYAAEIACFAKRFLDVGIEARHLRGWRVAVEREVGLFEQLVQPLLRQRNPESRANALAELRELESLGGELRAAMMRSALAPHGVH